MSPAERRTATLLGVLLVTGMAAASPGLDLPTPPPPGPIVYRETIRTAGERLQLTTTTTSEAPQPTPTVTTSTTQPPTTTTTTVPAQPIVAAVVRRWEPADECAKITPAMLKPGHFAGTMRWCPGAAYYLDLYERRGLGRWENGDLRRYMATMSCESGGNPRADNPHSSAFGLMQFLDSTWAWMVREDAAGRMGFDNPNRRMALDQIAFGVYLAKEHGWTHWRCWRRYE